MSRLELDVITFAYGVTARVVWLGFRLVKTARSLPLLP